MWQPWKNEGGLEESSKYDHISWMNHSFIREAIRKKGSAGRGTPLDFQTPLLEAFMAAETRNAAGLPACLPLFHCALTRRHTQVFIRSPEAPSTAFLLCVCVCVCQPRFMSTNMPPLSGGVRFSARLYESKLVADGRAQHFNATHPPLTPFNWLTCINRL